MTSEAHLRVSLSSAIDHGRGATTGTLRREPRSAPTAQQQQLRTAEHTLLPMNLLLLYTLLSVANAWSPPYKLLLHSVPPANTINYCVQRVPLVIAKFDPTERHPDRARGGSDKKRGGRGRGRGRGRGGRGGKRSPTAKPAIGDRASKSWRRRIMAPICERPAWLLEYSRALRSILVASRSCYKMGWSADALRLSNEQRRNQRAVASRTRTPTWRQYATSYQRLGYHCVTSNSADGMRLRAVTKLVARRVGFAHVAAVRALAAMAAPSAASSRYQGGLPIKPLIGSSYIKPSVSLPQLHKPAGNLSRLGAAESRIEMLQRQFEHAGVSLDPLSHKKRTKGARKRRARRQGEQRPRQPGSDRARISSAAVLQGGTPAQRGNRRGHIRRR